MDSRLTSDQDEKHWLPSSIPDSASLSPKDVRGLGLSELRSGSYLSHDKYSHSANEVPVRTGNENPEGDFLESSEEQDDLDQPARPAFHPLFTVIQDLAANGTSYHHPHVHYIFSDDDPDPITESLLQTIDSSEDATGTHQERVVIIDVAADGHTIATAKSLSSDWQLTSTEVQLAPTFDDADAVNEAGLMLSIIGTARPPTGPESLNVDEILHQAQTGAEGDAIAAMESLAEHYAQEMTLLSTLSHLEETQD